MSSGGENVDLRSNLTTYYDAICKRGYRMFFRTLLALAAHALRPRFALSAGAAGGRAGVPADGHLVDGRHRLPAAVRPGALPRRH